MTIYSNKVNKLFYCIHCKCIVLNIECLYIHHLHTVKIQRPNYKSQKCHRKKPQ